MVVDAGTLPFPSMLAPTIKLRGSKKPQEGGKEDIKDKCCRSSLIASRSLFDLLRNLCFILFLTFTY